MMRRFSSTANFPSRPDPFAEHMQAADGERAGEALGVIDRPLLLGCGAEEIAADIQLLRQIDRQRQPDRSGADHHDGVTRGVAGSPILIGVTTVTELDFGRLRHALNWFWPTAGFRL